MLPPLKKQAADVCLIVEDSYPYRQGGEATWVHNLITALPRTKFAVVHVSTNRLSKVRRGLRFKLPKNVTTVLDAFIFDPPRRGPVLRKNPVPASRLKPLFAAVSTRNMNAVLVELVKIAPHLSFDAFWAMPETKEAVASLCECDFPDEPFIDFVAHTRESLLPFWNMAELFERVPLANSYHVVGTGHAGLLGVMARLVRKKPLLVSELAVTVRNRIGELLRAEWSNAAHLKSKTLRHLEIEFHLLAARLTYESADKIVSTFGKNAAQQVEFGADRDKIQVIPSGIELSRYETVRRKRIEQLRVDPDRATVGFLGRISPQKDLKTVIQAARLTIDQIPHASFVIAGAKTDDRLYFHECAQLVKDLGLKKQVSFPGHLAVDKALPEFDVLVASNLNDGQPVSILEAFASQIPVVATDVGDCERLLLGSDRDDPRAGLIVGVGDARRMADAFIELLSDPAKRYRFGSVARERAEANFPRSEMIQSFQDVYDQFCGRVIERKSDVDKRRRSQPKPAGHLT